MKKRALYTLIIFFVYSLTMLSQTMVVTKKDMTTIMIDVDDLKEITFADNVDINAKYNDTLKILAIGNSFTEDGARYLKDILESERINPDYLEIYTMIAGGTALSNWNDYLANDTERPLYKIYGSHGEFADSTFYTMKTVLNYDWDIVMFQQISNLYYDTTTYEPYLTNLIDGARKYSKGDPRIAIQMPWSRNSKIGEGDIIGETGWENNVKASKYIKENYDVDYIVPTGTAIQHARRTDICPKNDFTRDDIHLAFGGGVFVAGMTWYGTLIAPFFQKNIYKSTFTYKVLDWEKSFASYETMDVTDDNRPILIECVSKAIISPYK